MREEINKVLRQEQIMYTRNNQEFRVDKMELVRRTSWEMRSQR